MTNNLDTLITTVRELRGPNGCEWDKAQTFETLAPYILEEGQELVDGLKNHDIPNIQEELGDVLLHVVMISLMAEEQGLFTLNDVITTINDKMIRRHPHVFGDVKVSSIEDIKRNWEAIKKAEKQ